MKSPLITMSAVTGKPDKAQIFEYMSSLKRVGIEAVLVYPRSGCEIEYLSDEWFSCVGNFVECAQRLDMLLWLYDDFNWPSGDAGGMVTAVDEYRLCAICIKGENAGKVSRKSRHNSGLFGEKFFPNLLSCEAVDYFIDCTHEKYYRLFGEYFGTVIKGMYTDEPSIGYCCEQDSLPYYDGMEKDYYDLCGRDFYYDIKNGHENLFSDTCRIVSNRFNSCYISKLATWCKSHGIEMTGHMMCDDSPFWAIRHGGDFLENLSTFTLPGIDEIFTDFANEQEMSLFGVAEYASGKQGGAMAELFALGPCDMSYAKKRCMLHLASCFKINHYFLAISPMDMRGNLLVKDYFNDFTRDQPDFSGMELLAREAKIAAENAKKDFVPDVYIRYPYSVSARKLGEFVHMGELWSLINKLTYKGVQWKFINDENVSATPLVEMNGEMHLELDGKKMNADEIAEHLKGSILITDKDGKSVSGIFVRRFDDGSEAILNLFAPADKYIINGKELFLETYDVCFLGRREEYKKVEFVSEFDVIYSNPNVLRAMFVNGAQTSEIISDSERDVVIAVRDGVAVSLNGEDILCNRKAEMLPMGMKEFYKISDPVCIKSGINTVSAGNDFKYMPSALIIGSFSAKSLSGEVCSIELNERKHTYLPGEKIYDYGRVSLTADVNVPQGAGAIEIKGAALYTEVYVNGTLAGKAIAPPYVFDIENDLLGEKIKLEIVQYSSMGSIFGDVAYWDNATSSVQWRGTPSTQNTPFGFSSIGWIFK